MTELNIDSDRELSEISQRFRKRRVRTIEERMLTYFKRYGVISVDEHGNRVYAGLLPEEIFDRMKIDRKTGFRALRKLVRQGKLSRDKHFVISPDSRYDG